MAEPILPLTSGIYSIVNKVNGKRYVGSSVCLRKRCLEHYRDLIRNTHYNEKIQLSWNKYGASNFEFEVLEEIIDKNNLITREQYWIDFYKSVKYGLNISPTAGSPLGVKRTKETIQKYIKSNTGRPCSVETRKKISEGNKGKVIPEDVKKRIRIAKIGSKHSEETKLKMSLAKIGKKKSPETIARMSGKKKSPESIAKREATKRMKKLILQNT